MNADEGQSLSAPAEEEPSAPGAPRLGWLQDASQGSFFHLVASLESSLEGSHEVGKVDPSLERIRFRHDPALGSPAGEVSRARPFTTLDGASAVEVTTTFLGLSGTVSPLPSFMAEEVTLEDPDVRARSAFLDLFHHRALSLLYRLMRDYRASTALQPLAAACGLATVQSGASQGTFPAELLPLCIGRARGPWVLKIALETTLRGLCDDVSVKIVPFTGGRRPLDNSARFALGHSNNQLGDSALLGAHLEEPNGHVTIQISGVRVAQLIRLRPGGDLFKMVRFWVDRASDAPARFTLEVQASDHRALRLRNRNNLQQCGRLGIVACLGTRAENASYRIVSD